MGLRRKRLLFPFVLEHHIDFGQFLIALSDRLHENIALFVLLGKHGFEQHQLKLIDKILDRRRVWNRRGACQSIRAKLNF